VTDIPSAQPAEAPPTQPAGRALFVRQSSGLVREVSVRNALFFNAAAFIGAGIGWYPVFYALPFIAVGMLGPFSTYGLAAIITGVFCILVGLIYASLSTVMPRSGGDYVFTSRFIPKAGPFIAWVESFTLVFASLAIIAFEVPIVLRNLQISGRIVGIGTGNTFMASANGWFTNSSGSIVGWQGLGGSLIVLLVIFWVVIQPTRRFHRIVTVLAILGLACAAVMCVVGLLLVHPAQVVTGLEKFAHTTPTALAKVAKADGTLGSGVSFAPDVFALMVGVLLFQYIGFQYSSYIAGEVRGNVKKSILIAVIGALILGVFMNSVYVDLLSGSFGFGGQVGWGTLFWLGSTHLPLGQPNSMPLVAAIAQPGVWPIWLIVSLGSMLFPFLLCPVYINFISRVSLAWSLDRQVPEWFGVVSERLRAPINSIMVALGISVVLVILENFPLLPRSITQTGYLNLESTAWFAIVMLALTWIMPGINAIVARFSRPDLIRNAPFRRWLIPIGVVWAVFALVVYYFAGALPIWKSLTTPHVNAAAYLRDTGLTFSIGIVVFALVYYVIRASINRMRGIDTQLLYQEIPPD